MEQRKSLWFVVLLLCAASLVFAQEQVATLSPAKPKLGDELVLTYHTAAKAAALGSGQNITAEVLLMKDSELPQLIELPMKSSGTTWKASFNLSDEKARVILVRFASGEKKDDQGGNVWETMVHGADGKPLQGAHAFRFQLLQAGSYVDFKHAKDTEVAKAELALERQLYPGNYNAAFMQWNRMMRDTPGDETKAKVKEDLEKLYAGASKKDIGFAQWFDQLGMKEKAEEVRKAAAAADPNVAESVRFTELTKEADVARRIEGLEKFIAALPNENKNKESYQRRLLDVLIAAKEYEKAYALVESLPKKEGMIYNTLAWPLIEKGEQLEKATAWAKRGVDLVRNPDPASKPPYLSMAAWKKPNEMGLGMILDTYGFGLIQLGNTKEAEGVMQEAYVLTKGADEDVNARTLETYLKNGKYEKVIGLAEECVQKGKANDKLVEAYKTAYVKVKGSEQGFEAAIEQAKATAKSDMKKEVLKSMVNKPAVDFALQNLDGKTVKLSELKGKVVVVDFWATWCGPCKASFPYLQKVYDKYKGNPNVVILALNTWENVSGKEREDLVKKFMADNKYTFPVLYDQGFVEKYGVEGIPTKFVIDKRGMIQFKSVGFLGGDKMVEELTMQLEMLLDDKFYSMN